MKKVLALVMSLTIVMTFFSFNVFAAGDGYYNYRTSKSATKTVNNVSVKVTGVELANPDYSTTTQQGIYSYYSSVNVVYTVNITNNNSTSYYLSNLWIRPEFDESTYDALTTSIDNFSTDIIGTIDSTNGGIGLVPDADWSFLGNICVPANTSMTAVFTVGMRAYKYSTSSSVSAWFYPDITSMYISNFGATSTDFTPQGAHDDILISLEALRNFLIGNTGIPAINSTLTTISNELIQIEGYVDDIERLLTWVGTYTSASIGNKSNGQIVGNNYKVVIRNFGSRPVTDFEILPPNTVVTDTMYIHPIQVEIETNFNDDQSITGNFVINDFIASASTTFDNPVILSDSIVMVALAEQSGYYDAYIRYSQNVVPKGKQYNAFWIYIYSRSSYIPINSDFTVIFNTSNYSSELSNQSDSIANQSDAIHNQEEIWYNQNSQAMQSVGLSNYQYSQQQYNGILGVTFQFEQLWNALGSWTLVYIFTLMLSLATFIIRHRPTTKMQQRMMTSEINREASLRTRLAKDQTFRANYERAWWRHHK